MAEYSWGFSAPASPIKITKGTNTYTYTGMAIPMGGYSYTVTDFDENDEVTISAVGYNKITATVGEVTIVMTEMPEVEVLNPNGTNYAITDAKARQQVADLETNVYNDLQNYVTKDTQQTITGAKTFELNPIIPSPGANDNTTKATTTAWVRTVMQPAASYDSSASMTWGSVYTCPANGYVRIGAKARDNSYAYLRLNSTSGTILWQHGDYGGASIRYGIVPVAKGIKVVAHGGASDQSASFWYGK